MKLDFAFFKKKSGHRYVGDEQANCYAFQCLSFTLIMFLVIFILNKMNVFIVNSELMAICLLWSVGIYAVAYFFCAVVSRAHPITKYFMMFFIVSHIMLVSICLTYHAVLLSAFPIVYSIMYRSRRFTLYTYCLNAVSLVAIVILGYRHGLCDANMALLTSDPLASYLTASGTFSLTEVQGSVSTLLIFFVLPRCLILGVLALICTSISKIIGQTAQKAKQFEELANIDGMTGLFNKSRYLNNIQHSYFKEPGIAVFFFDINNLKFINDTYGHDFGDKLIVTVANLVKQLESEGDRSFRIGGDEFVMVMREASENAMRNKIITWEQNILKQEILPGEPVSVSYGYARGRGSEIDSVIHQAEDRMYEDKKHYHEIRENEFSGDHTASALQ